MSTMTSTTTLGMSRKIFGMSRRTLGTLVRNEMRLALREPGFILFGVGMPIVLVIILGCVPSFREANPDLDGARTIDVYLPIAIIMAMALLGLNLTSWALANYRDKGVLKRLSTTPVNPASLLAAQGAVMATTAVIVAILLHAIGAVAFGVPAPEQPIGYVLTFLLAVATLISMGLLIAAVAPSGGVANGIGVGLFYPLMFLAGLWAPREVLPDVIVKIGDATPLAAAVGALQDSMEGSWPSLTHVGVLLAYTVVCGFGAARLFRWT